MPWIITILTILWVIGMFTGTSGWLIHLLIVIAVVMLILHIRRKGATQGTSTEQRFIIRAHCPMCGSANTTGRKPMGFVSVHKCNDCSTHF